MLDLTTGFTRRFGVRLDLVYNSTVHFAQRYLRSCPIFILARIVWAEYHFCLSRGCGLSAEFYRGVSRAYRVASDVLACPNSSVELKVSAIMNLQAMEMWCGREDLQKVHLHAFESLLGNKDLASLFLDGQIDISCLPMANRMTHQFAGVFEFKVAERAKFERAIRTLRKDSICIHHWLACLMEQVGADNREATEPGLMSQLPNLESLRPLLDYLLSVIEQYLVKDEGRAAICNERRTAAIALLFHAYITPTELHLNELQYLRLLHAWQKYILEVTVDDSKLQVNDTIRSTLHPALALAALVSVRSGQANGHRFSFNFPTDTSQEIKLWTSAVNAVKLAGLLSQQTIVDLAHTSLDLVIAVTKSTVAHVFTFCELNKILVEMRSTWQERVQEE